MNTDGTLAFSVLETYAENLFGVRFGLYTPSPDINTVLPPNPSCSSATGTNLISAKIGLLRTVAAMVHIVSRFAEVKIPNPANSFKLHVGRNYWLSIQLNALNTEDRFTGYTPPPSNNLFLGSSISMSGIVHEFGHVIDRNFSYRASAPLIHLYLLQATGDATYNENDPGANPTQNSRGMLGRGL